MLRIIQRIRVEWAHCDPARIIFNPNYYIWMDQGTHQLLEAAGFAFAENVRTTDFRGCPLVTSGAEFLTPAYFSDVIELSSQVERFGTKSFTVRHEFHRQGTLLAKGHEIRVWAYGDPENPDRMVALAMPDAVKAGLSAEGTHDVSP